MIVTDACEHMFCIIQTQLRLCKLLPMFFAFSISSRHLQPLTVSQTHRQQHLPCTHDSIQQNTIFPMINPVLIVIVVAWAHLIHPLCESTRNPRHPSLSAAFIVSSVRQKRIFLALERLIAGVSQRWMYEETNSSNLDEDSTISPTGAQSILCTPHMTLLTYRAAHAAFNASLMNACIRLAPCISQSYQIHARYCFKCYRCINQKQRRFFVF